MASWRACRKEHPHLFEKVMVWGQRNAYQDEVVSCFHSDLLREEFQRPLVHFVDMFTGELAEQVERLNFLRGQIKNIIGPKQTGLIQVTDLFFSKNGKEALYRLKEKQRRLMTQKAMEEGEAAKLEAGAYEVMEAMNAMHSSTELAAAKGKVEASWRKSAYPAYEPGKDKLRKAEGERWTGLPLGGSNLSQSYLDMRFTGLDEQGIPERPDWGKLHRLRQDRKADAMLKKQERRKSQKAALMDSLKPDSAFAKKCEGGKMSGFWIN